MNHANPVQASCCTPKAVPAQATITPKDTPKPIKPAGDPQATPTPAAATPSTAAGGASVHGKPSMAVTKNSHIEPKAMPAPSGKRS